MPALPFRLAALAALLLASSSWAQDGGHPRRGPFVGAAVGEARYDQGDPPVLFCFCERDHARGLKFGGGYRFGVTSVEAWVIDFGRAEFGPADSGPGSRSRARSLVLGPSWTARFGESFEGSWRVGMAATRVESNGLPTRTVGRVSFGMGLGWWFTPSTSVELGIDLARGRTGADETVDLRLVALGLRQRF